GSAQSWLASRQSLRVETVLVKQVRVAGPVLSRANAASRHSSSAPSGGSKLAETHSARLAKPFSAKHSHWISAVIDDSAMKPSQPPPPSSPPPRAARGRARVARVRAILVLRILQSYGSKV